MTGLKEREGPLLDDALIDKVVMKRLQDQDIDADWCTVGNALRVVRKLVREYLPKEREIWDESWRRRLQYDPDPTTAGLSIPERVRRLASLGNFVEGSPLGLAIQGHMLAIAKPSAQERARYEFLRDSVYFVARWDLDSRFRVYRAGEPRCELLEDADQEVGYNTATDAIDAAIARE